MPSHPISSHPSHLIPFHPIPLNLRINPPQPAPSNSLQSPSILLNPTFSLLLVLLVLLLPLLSHSQSIKYKSSNMYVHTIDPTQPYPTILTSKKNDTTNPSASVSFSPFYLEESVAPNQSNHTIPHLTFSFLRNPTSSHLHLISSTNHNPNHNHHNRDKRFPVIVPLPRYPHLRGIVSTAFTYTYTYTYTFPFPFRHVSGVGVGWGKTEGKGQGYSFVPYEGEDRRERYSDEKGEGN